MRGNPRSPASGGERISAIIPALNEVRLVPALVRRLRDGAIDEIIVVDGGSADGTRDAAAACADAVVVAPKGRGSQIAAGADASNGSILWVVHADCAPPDDARARILDIMRQPGVALGCFPIRFDRRHPLLAVYSYASKFDSPLTTFGDQGFFFRRSEYFEAGGAPNMPLFEDVELRRRLRKRGLIRKAKSPMITSARRFNEGGVLSQQVRNAALLALYWSGASPDQLAKRYNPPRHRPTAAGLTDGSFPRTGGGTKSVPGTKRT